MKKACKANLPAMIFLFALLILWQAGAMGLDAAYILPSPTQILAKLWELRDVLFTVHLPATMLVTAIGLGISLVLGLALAVVMDESDLVRKMIYPIVVVSQTIPTTAIAPLFVLWFGYGIWSKVLVTVLITFFPITITVYDGLRSAKTEMAELLETYGATKKDIFLKIKVPCALPYFFSAVKMAVPMSIIGAAIGEWLGAKSGLGYFSRRMMTQLDGAGVFAPIVLLSAAAILAVAIVNLLEKRFVRWRGESRNLRGGPRRNHLDPVYKERKIDDETETCAVADGASAAHRLLLRRKRGHGGRAGRRRAGDHRRGAGLVSQRRPCFPLRGGGEGLLCGGGPAGEYPVPL